MKTSVFANEKRLQKLFGLRNRPERFSSKENAISFASRCIKSQMIVYLDENPIDLIPGYYVVCPADYSCLEHEAEGIFHYVSPFNSL